MIPSALRGPLLGRLGFRLMAAVGLALTPLAFLAYFQTERFEAAAQERWRSALFGETLLAATPHIDEISRARGLAAATAINIVPIIDDDARCSEVMFALQKDEPTISFAGFVRPDGRLRCGSSGVPHDFGMSAGLVRLNADPKPTMTINPDGPISGESVLIFSHPVIDAGGRVLGYVTLSMPHRALQQRATVLSEDNAALGKTLLTRPLALITFDGDGRVLSSIYGLESVTDRLPADRKLMDFVDKPPESFLARTPEGDLRTFAVLAIVPGSLYVLGSWPASIAASSPFSGALPLWAFPTAMWLASLLAAWLAAEQQVLRPIRSLRRSITAFAGGNRTVDPPDLSAAPNELRDVGDAYERMMLSVIHDEAELEDSLHQKEVLLREVHHRVKNNLQLIASIMNLQMRKSVAPEARQLLKGLHDRVMSLATVHRELYQTSGLTDVQADELLQTIVGQVMRIGAPSDRHVDTKTSFDAIRLVPDQAVPLALMLTEALTNALKHSGQGAPGARNVLTVSFQHSTPGHAVLEVSNTAPGGGSQPLAPGIESTGLGHQLLTAFATQLSGRLEVGESDGLYTVRVDFPLSASHDLEPAEAAP